VGSGERRQGHSGGRLGWVRRAGEYDACVWLPIQQRERRRDPSTAGGQPQFRVGVEDDRHSRRGMTDESNLSPLLLLPKLWRKRKAPPE
jgi:hypothetical protein